MMTDPTRRRFMEATGLAAAALGMPLSSLEAAQRVSSAPSSSVYLTGDGLNLTPAETVSELSDVCASAAVSDDEYGLGGSVEEVEKFFARLLGKERALFMPTGTLANHLAIRALARDRRRVVVQEMSHVYNDTGDACQILSGLTLLPLAPERATFAWSDVERVLARTASGRVSAPVGAISIESPVRRQRGELFDRAEMVRICNEARQRSIGTHLDGARLFIASAYTRMPPSEYAAPFDTVYVSLWKYFNSINGAILAGPSALLDGMFHVRRMFGGALWNAWPFALLARRYADGFVERLTAAVGISEAFIRALEGSAARVERIPNGSNIFRLIVPESKAEPLRERLAAKRVVLGSPAKGPNGAVFHLQVNETWNRTTAARLVEQFTTALA